MALRPKNKNIVCEHCNKVQNHEWVREEFGPPQVPRKETGWFARFTKRDCGWIQSYDCRHCGTRRQYGFTEERCAS